MADAGAVVIPFGVPEHARGLGVGLAALLHAFTHADGSSVALAQLQARRGKARAPDAGQEDAAEPVGVAAAARQEPETVEALVPPSAWLELTGNRESPTSLRFVITGSLEPPTHGRGHVRVVAYDATNGTVLADAERAMDAHDAGRAIVAALEPLAERCGLRFDLLRPIEELEWEPLESVLRAERGTLFDPQRGRPSDRLAAMLHLGRAVADAPDATFPAARLATLALEAVMSGDDDEKLTDAAVRALTRARDDAPERVELLEALSAVELRRGRADAAKAHADAARHLAPERPRVYAMLSEALRALGDRTGARAVLDEGLERAGKSPLLVVERALVAAEAGDFALAEQMLSALLDEHPLFAPAFVHLTSLLAHRRDTVAMARLVDAVLSELMRHTGEADRAVSPDVLRRAMELTVAFEPEGVARSARVERLGQALVVLAPEDAWAKFELARALSEVGDRAQAVSLLADVQRLAPRSSLAAEAARARFALEHPEEAHAIELAMRHAQEADTEALADIAVGAHRMAMVHGIWTAHLAAAIAERRRGRAATARKVLDVALATAPGCAPALAEAVRVSLEEGDARAAVGYAERLSDAERESPRSLALLALAFAKDGNEERARRVFARAKAQDAFDPTVAEVGLALERLLERSADGAPSSRRAGPSGSSRPGGEGPIERVRALLRRFGRGG